MSNKDGKAVVNYEEILAGMAKAATEKERPQGTTIGTRAGVLTYGGTPIPNNKLDCIVIASTHANLYYEDKFDSDNLTNPSCYAYGEVEKDMAPHPSVAQPQHANCHECPKNQWKSADNGKGKACKNSRHLALIPANVKADDVQLAEVAILKLPVTSVGAWGMYVNKLATLFNRPPLAMETQVGTVPDAKSQFKVTFAQLDPVANYMLQPLIAKAATVAPLIERVYEVNVPRAVKATSGKY